MKNYTTEVRREHTEFHRELSAPLCVLHGTRWNSNIHTPLPQKTTVGPPLLIEGTYMSPFEEDARFIGWGMSEKAKTKISLRQTADRNDI